METVTLTQGIDGALGWILTNADGTPANPEGLSVLIQVRQVESPTAPLLVELDSSVETIDGETVIVGRWAAEDSLAWPWRSGALDVRLSRDGRPVQIVDQCLVRVDPIVSHEEAEA